jgi:hypothetical protein
VGHWSGRGQTTLLALDLPEVRAGAGAGGNGLCVTGMHTHDLDRTYPTHMVDKYCSETGATLLTLHAAVHDRPQSTKREFALRDEATWACTALYMRADLSFCGVLSPDCGVNDASSDRERRRGGRGAVQHRVVKRGECDISARHRWPWWWGSGSGNVVYEKSRCSGTVTHWHLPSWVHAQRHGRRPQCTIRHHFIRAQTTQVREG